MAGKIESPASQALIRPWGDGWQVWKQGKKRGNWVLDRRGALVDLKIPARSTCAVPARMAIAVCFWVEAQEEQVVREMAFLELEMKGLIARDRAATDVGLQILIPEKTRTFVQATIFPQEWSAEAVGMNGERYEASPALMVLADQTMHLWREEDDIVAALVWRGKLICWETMHWTTDERPILAWLKCLMVQLRHDLQIAEKISLQEWVPLFREAPLDFVRGSSLTERDREEGPCIVFPGQASRWLPPARRIAEKAGRQRRILATFAACFVVLLLIALGAGMAISWNTRQKIEILKAQIAESEREVGPLRETEGRWRQIEAAVDPGFYPVEMLHLVVGALPASGVRLTVFEMSPESVLVEGEADNVSAATEFLANIQKARVGDGITWEMPPPLLQANNTARFVINGVRDAE